MLKKHSEILEGLPKVHADRVRKMSDAIGLFKDRGAKEIAKDYKHTLRGYIVCLHDMGLIGRADMKRLIAWYVIDRFGSYREWLRREQDAIQ